MTQIRWKLILWSWENLREQPKIKDTAENLAKKVKDEANKIINDAKKKADSIVNSATNEANSIKKKAEEEYNKAKEDAENQINSAKQSVCTEFSKSIKGIHSFIDNTASGISKLQSDVNKKIDYFTNQVSKMSLKLQKISLPSASFSKITIEKKINLDFAFKFDEKEIRQTIVVKTMNLADIMAELAKELINYINNKASSLGIVINF